MKLLERLAARSRTAAFILGMIEFRRSVTWASPDHRDDLDDSYDEGRDFAHRLTFRNFEDA